MSRWRTVAGAAVLVAAVTVVARVAGFGRWLVFADAVGATCLGTAYTTANMVPNIVFEVVAGGALAGAVVPLLAAPVARGDIDTVRRTASALLTWTAVVLLPVSLLGLVVAEPLMRRLVGTPAGCDGAATAAVAAGMLLVFTPQVVLYGIAVVCGGLLNAHRRFLAAAAAPLLSTVVVIAAYAWFGAGYDGDRDDVAALPDRWALVLSVGTTAGVLALTVTMALPVRRLGLGLRPTLRFPPGVARQARGLAGAGLAGLVAQQLSLLVVIVLANDVGGALNVYTFAWAVYLLPWAVLAVPVATSAFTAVSEQAGSGDREALAGTVAATTRAVLLVSALGAGVMAGTATPVARTFLAPGAGTGPEPLAAALVAFAPGLVGYGLVALLTRVLYAQGAGRPAALAVVAGWAVAAAGAVLLVRQVPDDRLVAAIGWAHAAGMTLAAVALLAAVQARTGSSCLGGLPRAGLAAAAGAGAALFVAQWVSGLAVPGSKPAAGLLGVGAGLAGALAFAVVVVVVDSRDLRVLLARRRGAVRA